MRPCYDKNYLVNGDMSGDIIGQPLTLQWMYGYSMQAVFAGSPAGTIKLRASLDKTTWTDISGSSYVISAPGSYFWNVTDVFYPWVRVEFVNNGGAGVLNVQSYAKGS